MTRPRLTLISVVLFVYAVCCLISCDEDCPTCPAVPPDPTVRIIGLWTIFEAYLNGSPDPSSVGMEVDFRSNDTLFAFADTLEWFATTDRLVITQESPMGKMAVVFDYYFEADTLDMSGEASGFAIRWRLLEE